MGDYELKKIRTFDYYVEPKPEKKGLTEVKDWICKAWDKKEPADDFGSCNLLGIPYDSSSDFYWNRGSNFKPNQKYYAGDILKVSGRVEALSIFYFGSWHYKIRLVDGSFAVAKEAK